jgi:hypothetical protein
LLGWYQFERLCQTSLVSALTPSTSPSTGCSRHHPRSHAGHTAPGITTPPPPIDGDKPVDVGEQEPDRDEDDDPLEDPEAVHELHDRLIAIRRALDDLGVVTSELAVTHGRRKAQRILTACSRRSTSCPMHWPPRSPPRTLTESRA